MLDPKGQTAIVKIDSGIFLLFFRNSLAPAYETFSPLSVWLFICKISCFSCTPPSTLREVVRSGKLILGIESFDPILPDPIKSN